MIDLPEACIPSEKFSESNIRGGPVGTEYLLTYLPNEEHGNGYKEALGAWELGSLGAMNALAHS